MTPHSPDRRKVLIRALASVLAAFCWRHDGGHATEGNGSQSPHAEKFVPNEQLAADSDSSQPPAEERFATRLTVAVTGKDATGKDRPVPGAEVKVLSPSGIDAEPRTNAEGTVTFKLTGPGIAKIRVIAEGWESALAEVKLKEGKQRLAVQLTTLADLSGTTAQ